MTREIVLAGDMRKLASHPEVHEGRRVPISVQLSPTGRCNLHCAFCTRGSDPGREELDDDALSSIVKTLRTMGTKGIEITGGGEPTLHRGFVKLVESILHSGLDAALVTNGTMLHRIPLGLLGAMDWIRVSIATGPGRYETVHNARYYPTVIQNIHRLAECQRVHRGVSIIVDEHTDWEDIQRLLDDLSGARLDYIRIARDGKKLHLPFPQDAIDALRWPEDVSGRLLEAYRDVSVPSRCVIGYYKPTISHTGNIHRCCAEFNANANPQGSYIDMPRIWAGKQLDEGTRSCHGYPCVYARYNAFLIDCLSRPVRNRSFI